MTQQEPGEGAAAALAAAADRRRDLPLRGFALVLLGTGAITLNDAAMKWVIADHPIGEAIFVRSLFAILPIALLLRRDGNGWTALRWTRPRDVLLCAGLLVGIMFLFIFALSRLPLGTATIVIYAGPLFVTALAPFLLAEKVGWRRWGAVILGFLGVLIIFRPGGTDFSWLLLIPLAVALLVALRDLLLRRILARESAASILAISSLAVTACALPTALLGWTPLDLMDLALLAGAGLGFSLGIFCLTECLRYADASLLAPLKYSGVVWAILLGYLLWAEVPGPEVLAGAALIVASGLFILRRERRLEGAAPPPPQDR